MNNPYTATTADLSNPGGAEATYQPKVFAMKGRIGRVRYIAYSMGLNMAAMLVLMVVGGILAVVMGLSGADPSMFVLLAFVFYIPLFAIGFILAIRRAHDMGHSGWLSLLILVPLANLWFLFAPGTPTANEYGPKPVPNTTGVIIAAFSPLIVAVLFGVLAAISIPAYKAYQDKARAASEQAEVAAQEMADQAAQADAEAPSEMSMPAETTETTETAEPAEPAAPAEQK